MLRFRRTQSLQKFISVYASVFNRFSQDRSLSQRVHFKFVRTAALADWRGTFSAKTILDKASLNLSDGTPAAINRRLNAGFRRILKYYTQAESLLNMVRRTVGRTAEC
ncbi:hypothetical protein AB9F29_12290 [Falsihalocynthiibacter sp. S25ZX9]